MSKVIDCECEEMVTDHHRMVCFQFTAGDGHLTDVILNDDESSQFSDISVKSADEHALPLPFNALVLAAWSPVLYRALKETDAVANELVVILESVCAKTVNQLRVLTYHGTVHYDQGDSSLLDLLHSLGISTETCFHLSKLSKTIEVEFTPAIDHQHDEHSASESSSIVDENKYFAIKYENLESDGSVHNEEPARIVETHKANALFSSTHLVSESKEIELERTAQIQLLGGMEEPLQSVDSELMTNSKFCCQICSQFFHNRNSLKQHKCFSCAKCSKHFPLKVNLERHIQRQHSQKSEQKDSKILKERSANIKRSKDTTSKDGAKSSGVTKLHEAETATCVCRFCDEPFKSRTALRKHRFTSHPFVKQDIYRCPKCPKTFKQNAFLYSHLRCHSERFKCDRCGEVFHKMSLLVKHTSCLAKDEKPVGCPHCEMSFRNKYKLSGHLKLHKNQVFKCEQCEKKFAYESELRMHREDQHTQVRSFDCSLCSKAYTTDRKLRVHHRLKHSGNEKKYVCDMCGLKSHSMTSLKIHQRIHTGEKPAVCKECDMRFVCNSSLNLHMLKHGAKQFKCHLCSNIYARRHSLIDHLRTHTGEKPFACETCSKTFSSGTLLHLHKKTHTRMIRATAERANNNSSYS